MALKILLHIFVNAGALYIASALIDGVSIERDVSILVFAGVALWFGNSIIRPVLKLLTFPLMLLTFGLFNIVVNMIILWGVEIIIPQFEITGLMPLFLATIVVSLVNGLLFFI